MSDMSASNGKAQPWVHERIKRGDVEYEVSGPITYVKRRMDAAFTLIGNLVVDAIKPVQTQLPGFEQKNTPVLVDTDVLQSGVSDLVIEESPDLLTLYRKKSPQSQGEKILVIMYHRIVSKGETYLKTQDCENGFIELLQAGVKMPKNISARLDELKQQGLVYNPNLEQGKFALTDQGKEIVEKMGN